MENRNLIGQVESNKMSDSNLRSYFAVGKVEKFLHFFRPTGTEK
jgi:hypothetical protein